MIKFGLKERKIRNGDTSINKKGKQGRTMTGDRNGRNRKERKKILVRK